MILRFRKRLASDVGTRLTIGVQGLVTDADRRVLLVRQRYQPGWRFPGGGVERNEALPDALARELREEVGIATASVTIFGIYSNYEAFPGDHIVLFVVEVWTQSVAPYFNLEIADRRFFGLDALPDDITAATRRRLDEAFKGAARSEFW